MNKPCCKACGKQGASKHTLTDGGPGKPMLEIDLCPPCSLSLLYDLNERFGYGYNSKEMLRKKGEK